MAKMFFDLRSGVIEVDGEEQFVEKVYADLRSTLLEKVAGIAAAAPENVEESAFVEGLDGPKKTRRRPKSTGPSCPSRIEALKSDNFFNELRTSKEVGDKLREKGTAYEGKRIASALHNLTSAGKLRRMQEGGVWKYQNP